jgi:hypothetical protein
LAGEDRQKRMQISLMPRSRLARHVITVGEACGLRWHTRLDLPCPSVYHAARASPPPPPPPPRPVQGCDGGPALLPRGRRLPRRRASGAAAIDGCCCGDGAVVRGSREENGGWAPVVSLVSCSTREMKEMGGNAFWLWLSPSAPAWCCTLFASSRNKMKDPVQMV